MAQLQWENSTEIHSPGYNVIILKQRGMESPKKIVWVQVTDDVSVEMLINAYSIKWITFCKYKCKCYKRIVHMTLQQMLCGI